MIFSKEHIIKYFNSGIRSVNQFKVGIEHEKFLFDLNTNKRVNYQTILKMFKGLYEFGWKPILEKKNIKMLIIFQLFMVICIIKI